MGFALLPFQDPSAAPGAAPGVLESPSPAAMEELGRSHGEAAAEALRALAIPCPGLVIWLAGLASGVLMTRDTPLTNLRCDGMARWDSPGGAADAGLWPDP